MGGGSQTVRKERTHTGSAVKDLPGITIDEEKVVSFTEALKLKEVSEKLVVTGGGYIGLEMGSDWGSSLGSHVTAVEFGAAIVPSMAAQVRKSFQHSLEKQKLKSKLKTKVMTRWTWGNGLTLHREAACTRWITQYAGSEYSFGRSRKDPLYRGSWNWEFRGEGWRVWTSRRKLTSTSRLMFMEFMPSVMSFQGQCWPTKLKKMLPVWSF